MLSWTSTASIHWKKYLSAIKPTVLLALIGISQSLAATSCPSHFYSLPIPSDATTCHQFDDSFPASISFHTRLSLEQIESFYTASKSQLLITQSQLGRVVIQDENNQHRVVISKDGQGTQVDLLVINK
ncbi:hypothetical protein [Alteromonas sp. a30]|uniref:hypothetical protein n=1 Tax=Alteromonas sp. a30 TaxID=2730917 RepID=UPI00227EA1FF|nr:hypothetical protein [Alteromonas sp. a30]MCY7294475.1 hypothetical protein [Alteromonas sp. a30]